MFVAGLLMMNVVAFVPSSPAAALTKAQKQTCFNNWDGLTYAKGSAREGRFKASECNKAKGGNCTSTALSGQPVDENGDRIFMYRVTCVDPTPADTPADTTPVAQASGCKDANGNKISSIIPCGGSGNPIINMLLALVNFLAIGVGIAVVGGIVWGSITYIRSNGNSSIAQQGITIIINAVVGLLLFIFMYAIINFLVPGGLFT